MAEKSATCPICGDKAIKEDAPFCSQRCRDVDLNRWLNGSYAVPAQDQTTPSDPVNDNEQPE
ncbi:MAG: DNA gyrase inhibitor YacG [Hyphomicrobiales bacterium]